jgi:hypothetical protein
LKLAPTNLNSVNFLQMAIIFAQHAQAGEYHLETRYIEPGRSEWSAAPNRRGAPSFSGDARSLDGAMHSACHAVGLGFADWMPIGPAIEVEEYGTQ